MPVNLKTPLYNQCMSWWDPCYSGFTCNIVEQQGKLNAVCLKAYYIRQEVLIPLNAWISHIGKLRDFLLEHRKDYINAYSHVMSEYGRMTDTERDQIDQDAQTFMRTCSEAIQQLRTQAHKEIHSQQVKEHRTAVLDFIEDYLKRVCKLYSEQRAIRVKRVVDKKRLSKLEPEPNAKTRESMSSEKVSQSPSKDSEEKPIPEEYPEKVPVEAQPELGSWGDGKGEDELSPEEIQMFEQENQRLIGEMNSLFDEVRQIEGKVVEISRLQEIFTEKVLQQVRKNNVFSFNLKGHLLRTWDISPEVIRPPQLFPCGLAGKEYAFSAGDLGSIPGLGRFAGEGIGDHSSIPRLGRSPGEGIGYPLQYSWASLMAQLVKNMPSVQELNPWVGKTLWRREQLPLQYSGLENSMDCGTTFHVPQPHAAEPVGKGGS
ncbi:syntaxin-18 isoform X1 [Ovis aries]|uniref:syntaxin-18 isoform X1 n=1 Tax=Ovis aries TaxID=9940 RepID=UPI0029527AE3|nr:syntaxin-18 isoform X1 [Ovis aries]